jgi:hypothetical protein
MGNYRWLWRQVQPARVSHQRMLVRILADNICSSPKAVLRVGNANDIGRPQLSSLIVTTKGTAAGAVVIEWNVNGGYVWGKLSSSISHI